MVMREVEIIELADGSYLIDIEDRSETFGPFEMDELQGIHIAILELLLNRAED